MKKIRNIISLILAFSLVASLFAVPTSAEGFSYEFEKNSQSIYMYSLDNNECVYSVDADTQRPIASLTKIMTFIVVSECIPDLENTIVTVDQVVEDELEGTGSSLAGINVGEELSFLQLLNLMMVPSGNDAALAMAVYIDQHQEEIAQYLSTKSTISAAEEAASSDSEESTEEESSEYIEGDAKDIPDPVAVNDYTDGTGEVSESTESSTESSAESSAASDETSTDSTSDSTSTTTTSSGSGVSEASQYFVSLMNEKARELGCMDTHFVNPHGLNDSNHYSTARDLAKMVSYATTLPYFSSIVSQTSYTLPATNIVDEERTVVSTNKMLSQSDENSAYYYMYANGIKTGSHNEAGYCIAASATYEGYTYVCICLGSPMIDSNGETIDYHGEMVDAATLFRWAFLNLSMKNVAEAGDLLADIELEYAWNQDKLQLVAAENVSAILPSDVSTSSILTEVDIPEKVQAPIKKGEVIGTATFTYAGDKIATVNLVAAESVERSKVIQTIETTAGAFASPLVLIVIGLVILTVAIYVVIAVMFHRRKKKMKQIKRYRNL